MSWVENAASCFLVACFLILFGGAWRRDTIRQRKTQRVDELAARRQERATQRHPSGHVS